MKKAIPVIVALILIIIIGVVAFGSVVLEKYSYSEERADLNEYFQVSGEERAIVLQDEMIEEKIKVKDGVCYLDLPSVHKYLNEIFYVDLGENLLLYTTANDIVRVNIGETVYTDGAGTADAGYTIAYLENDTLYLALEFVKKYTNFSYDVYERQVQIYTEWGTAITAPVTKDTAVRVLGGIKSPILKDLAEGDTVEILEEMETWSKVKTTDAIIGYVENKRLGTKDVVQEVPVTDYVAPEYTSISVDKTVSLGWHAIGGVGGNDTLKSTVANTKGMNVIAPTWFSLNDNEGNFRNFGTKSYVTQAQGMGLQVWGVLDDFNYNNENGGGIDVYAILSSTTKRQHLVESITAAAVELGLNGINLDFERVTSDCGIHYIQFLRELSIQCRQNNLIFSIDNYVPFNFNDYYRLDVQGQVADYVIIMGYDEHWHGSGDPGSVASINYVSNGLDKTLEDVPAEKVINALPFYTIQWRTEGAKVSDNYLTLNNTAEFLARLSAQPVWDEETCQNYIEWKEGEVLYQVWLEDADSIKVKLNVMKARNIAGVAVWRLGYGTPEVWELLQLYTSF